MNRLRTIVKCKNPEILLITPLKIGDKVSKDTKKSIKRNKVPFEWVSYQDDNNPAMNTKIAYDRWVYDNGKVPYIMKIDNDITASRGMIDKLYNGLVVADHTKAYSYCSFEFTGCINIKFSLRKFDPMMLMKQNYISSCSLINTNILSTIGGFVTSNKYKGLLDWCLWLNFLKNGYQGQPVLSAHFSAQSSPKSISCWPEGGYQETRKRVLKDFCDFSLT